MTLLKLNNITLLLNDTFNKTSSNIKKLDRTNEIILCIVCIIIHLSVILLLRYERNKHTNGRKLTIHLSCIIICASLLHMIINTEFKYEENLNIITFSEYFCFGMLYFLLGTTLIIDRFLAIHWNIKYAVYITSKQCYITLLFYWLCTGLFLLWYTHTSLSTRQYFHMVCIKYMYPCIECIYVMLTITIYAYIFWKMKTSSVVPDYMKRLKPKQNKAQLLKKALRVSLVCLIGAVTLLPLLVYVSNDGQLNRTSVLAFGVIFIKDGVLHILLQEHLRDRFKRLTQKRNRVQPTDTGDEIFTLSYFTKPISADKKVEQWRQQNEQAEIKHIVPF